MAKNVGNDILRNEVYNDILNGATYSVLINKIVNAEYEGCNGFKYTKKSAESIVGRVKQTIREDYKQDREELKERLSTMLFDVYTEAREMGDRQAALKAVEQIAKMTGVNEAQKMEVSQKVTIDFGFDDKEEDSE